MGKKANGPFPNVFQKMSKTWSSERGGRKSNLMLFLTWMHFGRQGPPQELLGDFQEHVYMILTRFGNNFGSLSAKETKRIQKTIQRDDQEAGCKSNE